MGLPFTRTRHTPEYERPLCSTRLRGSGLGRAVWPRPSPAPWSSAGVEHRGSPSQPARAPEADREASSFGDDGPRRTPAGASSAWFVDGTPSGTEVSSGPSDGRRSKGRGVEEATGTTQAGTPGRPRPVHHSYGILHCEAGAVPSERLFSASIVDDPVRDGPAEQYRGDVSGERTVRVRRQEQRHGSGEKREYRTRGEDESLRVLHACTSRGTREKLIPRRSRRFRRRESPVRPPASASGRGC